MATEINVGVAVVNLIEDNQSNNILEKALLTTILSNGDLAQNILKTNLSSFDNKVNDYFNYGLHSFIHGLPEGSQVSQYINAEAIEFILESIVDEPINLLPVNLGEPDAANIAFQFLQETYSFNSTTHEVAHAAVPNADTNQDVIYKSAKIKNGSVDITYEINSPVETTTISYNISGLVIGDFYYIVAYSLLSAPDAILYWNYNINSHKYPVIEYDLPDTLKAPFFPICPIRTAGVNTSDSNSAPIIRSCKSLLSTIDIDLEKIETSLSENPDISVIDSAFITFTLDIQTTKPISLKYLYRFFHQLYKDTYVSKGRWEIWNDSDKKWGNPATIIDINEQKFKLQLQYNYMELTTHTGSVTTVGNVISHTSIKPPVEKGRYSGHGGVNAPIYVEVSTIVFTKQITINTYTRLLIHGFVHKSFVYKDEIVIKTLATSLEEGDSGFFIPLNRGITKSLTSDELIDLYYESLSLVIYAVQKTSLEWYQTGIFRVLVIVIVFVYIAYTYDIQGGLTALAAMSAVEIGLLILKLIVISKALELATDWLVNKIGGELALAVAAILAIVAIAYGDVTAFDTLLTAEQLLQASSSIIGSIIEFNEDALLDLAQESTDFLESYADEQEKLKEAYDLLGSDDLLDPFDIIKINPYTDHTESPTNFYERTIHTGNIGVLSLSMIETYVDNQLILPKPI